MLAACAAAEEAAAADVGEVTSLVCVGATGAEVSDLTGLDQLTYLTSIDLAGNVIANAAGLARWTG